MLKLEDIVALAKSGYKVSDVKELIELSKASEQEQKEDLKEKSPSEEHTQNIEEKKEVTQDLPKEPEKEEKVIDYKKKSEELEKKISDLQKANLSRNLADTDEKSDSELFADVMKSFM